MAEKQFNIKIAGDKTFEDNVKQSKEFYDNIVGAINAWKDGGKSKPFADQDKFLADLKKQIELNEALNKKIKDQESFIKALQNAQVKIVKNYSDEEKTLASLSKQIDELTAANRFLNKQEIKNFEQIAQNNIQIKELRKERSQLEKQTIDLKNQTILLEKAQNNENLTLGEKKQLYNIYLKQINNITDATEDQTEAQKDLIKTTNKLSQEIVEADQKSGNYKSTIGRYKEEVEKAVGQNKKFAISFTDIFGAFTAANLVERGIDLLIQGMQRLNEEIDITNELQEKLKTTFNATGDDLDKYTVKVKTLSAAYEGVDADTLTTSLNSVSKAFDANLDDVFANVEEGFAKGSNASGEFLNVLQASSQRVADSGISLEQYFSIINKAVTEGTYSDKGVELIAEGAQKLREYTQATKDALEPLDESVKLQIKQEIAAGNSFKALQLVSDELNRGTLSAKETQTIIADVFGSDAEDAGLQFTKMLGGISENLDDVADKTSELTKQNLYFQEQLQSVIVSLSGQNGEFAKVKAAGIEIAGAFLEAAQTSESLRDTLDSILRPFENIFDILEPLFELFGEGEDKVSLFNTVFTILGQTTQLALLPLNALTTAFKVIFQLFTDGINPLKNFIDTIKDSIPIVSLFVEENEKLLAVQVKQIQNYREVSNKEASLTELTEEQLKERAEQYRIYIDAINDLEQLRINTLQDGQQKEIDQAALNFRIKKQQYAGNAEAIELIELEHRHILQEIQERYNTLEIEAEAEKQAEILRLQAEVNAESLEQFETEQELAKSRNDVILAALEDTAVKEKEFELKQLNEKIELLQTIYEVETNAEIELLQNQAKILEIEIGKLTEQNIETFSDYIKSYFGISDETFEQLSNLYSASKEFINNIKDLGAERQQDRLNELEQLQQANEDEIKSEEDKLSSLQELAEKQNGIELQRTQNSINFEKIKLENLKATQSELIAEEEATQQKLKNIQKIAILGQLAADVGSAFGSLLKYSEGNPLNLVNPLTAPLLYAAGTVRILSASATAYSSIKKLKKGGQIKGPKHEEGGVYVGRFGGTDYEVEGGEYMVNTEDTARMFNTISTINSGGNLQAISAALQKDTGHKIMSDVNLKLQKDRQELNILKKQTNYLKKLVNLQLKSKQYVTINGKTYEIQNGSKKLLN